MTFIAVSMAGAAQPPGTVSLKAGDFLAAVPSGATQFADSSGNNRTLFKNRTIPFAVSASGKAAVTWGRIKGNR